MAELTTSSALPFLASIPAANAKIELSIEVSSRTNSNFPEVLSLVRGDERAYP